MSDLRSLVRHHLQNLDDHLLLGKTNNQISVFLADKVVKDKQRSDESPSNLHQTNQLFREVYEVAKRVVDEEW